MKWFEYKQEVDAIHAPDSLKAKLLAMQAASSDAASASAPAHQNGASASPSAVPRKRAAPIPWKRILALAACFAFGVIACDAFGWSIVPRMGGSAMAFSTDSADGSYAGAADKGTEYYASAEEGANYAAENSATTDYAADAALAAGTAGIELPTYSDRKIIYNANLSLESKTYDDTLSTLTAAVSAAGGYIESSDESNYGNSRYCCLTCRIPADQYNDFLTSAAAAGSLVSKSQSAQDITASYVDIEARISALEAQRNRLLELQQQADNLADLLQIEDSLTNVQYQLESYDAQKKTYDNQIDYCTVTIDLSEVETFTPVETNFWQKLGNSLSNALYGFGQTLANFVFWLAGIWPWLLILCIVLVIVWLIRKKRIGGRK